MKNTPWNNRLCLLQNRVSDSERYVANAEQATKKAWEAWKKAAESENRLRNELLKDSNALASHWAIKDKDKWEGQEDA